MPAKEVVTAVLLMGTTVVIVSVSVGTKEIPPNVVADGVHFRVIRAITEKHTAYWKEQEAFYYEHIDKKQKERD